MSTVTIPATCQCGSIGRTDLRQCPDHFHIWRGDKRLPSVGSILKAVWPQGQLPPADVLENARERGSEVDQLFAEYVRGNLRTIPAGTRKDARSLFLKLKGWYDKQNFKTAEAQVVLGAEDHGGVLDFRFDGVPCELKATYDVDQKYIMQAACYAEIDNGGERGMILHVTERYQEPRWLDLAPHDYDDWRTMLAHWRMLQRRGVKA